MLENLKQAVYEANMLLPELNLVTFTWGNVSAYDEETGYFAIKPSGVDYDKLKAEDIVIVDLDGKVVEGDLNPSSDTPTHAYLYQHFKQIKGICHTHSPWAVSYASAGIPIRPLNTTHADSFYGTVPVAPELTQAEIESAYELNTGKVIVETVNKLGLDPLAVPAVLVEKHGPFTWGNSAKAAVYNAKVLEVVCEMNYHTMMLSNRDSAVPQYLLDKHYYRKHGKDAYYGQK